MFPKLGLLVFLSICVYMSRGFTKTDCNENHERVSCGSKSKRFTWNNEKKLCIEASYGGCNSTLNNFPSRLDCERVARPICTKDFINAMNAFSKNDCKHDTFIGKPLECPGANYKYFYDVWIWDNRREKCIEWVHFNCNGSPNRFANKEDCERIARPICTS
ncbi:unnamed protein product [Ceutorhynchus assimilis]|uniref:BPTI/Kunitz inhibitor domain-containing protein n=1 Tax=Ceutorhynchus assimilis TaxID=467358 RepID=A0A9N9MBN4_9CUCU|nr:unnamed protein product [Ceutorhynchus assimilis]